MKKIICFTALACLGYCGFAQSNEPAPTEDPKMVVALLQLQNLVINSSNTQPNRVKTNNPKNSSASNVAAFGSMSLSGTSGNTRNVNVFVIKDSKMKVVKTEPIRNGETPPAHLKAMKAAFGIKN